MSGHTQNLKEPAVARPTPKPAPAPVEDPLADLREPDAPGPPVSVAHGDHDAIGSRCQRPDCQEVHDPEPVLEVGPMVSQDVHDAMVAETVAAWHADPTSQGFLHGGGQCGCRYIARVALQAAVPVATEEQLEPADV